MTEGPVQENIVDMGTKAEEKPNWLVRILSWIASGGKGARVEEEVLRVDKDFILRVLPHRDRWLLVDAMEVTPQKITGFFTVTREVCEGHGIGGELVLPGVLLVEMANQVTGLWYATQHPELIGAGKNLFARIGGSYKASGFIKPGDLLRVEVDYANLSGSVATNRRGTFMELTGKKFTFTVGDKLVGTVANRSSESDDEIVIKGVEPPKIAPKT